MSWGTRGTQSTGHTLNSITFELCFWGVQRVSVLTTPPLSGHDLPSLLYCPSWGQSTTLKSRDLAIPEILSESLKRFTCISASVDKDASCLHCDLCKPQILMEKCQNLEPPPTPEEQDCVSACVCVCVRACVNCVT